MSTSKPLRLILILILLVAFSFSLAGCSLFQTESPPEDLPGTLEPAPEEELPEDPQEPTPPLPEEKPPIVRAGYEEILAAVAGLSTESSGFGPGNSTDENNRPLSALSYEAKYGEYGLIAMTDDDGVIYLTFDQGYENGYTTPILDILKEKNVRATFFVTMSYAKKNPELIKRMLNEGHVIGNHSNTHPSMPTLSVQDCINEIMSLHDYILDTYGYEMTLFRPPSGEFSITSLEIARLLGYQNVFWSFAYVDWETDNQPEPTAAYERITSKTHDGAIYLLHSVSSTNATILGDVIDYWQSNGFEVKAYQ
ncbi:MAG: polysaccharide deacetylase [Firmicutes bacterium HGW-Firmicutes-11]|jgi:peptidoglycan-N-acetylmuramic acid deacetylase|nr:MAG: polysaccharide deacetylase [Firmicutes bacterium HGW-Firmicutes-11]